MHFRENVVIFHKFSFKIFVKVRRKKFRFNPTPNSHCHLRLTILIIKIFLEERTIIHVMYHYWPGDLRDRSTYVQKVYGLLHLQNYRHLQPFLNFFLQAEISQCFTPFVQKTVKVRTLEMERENLTFRTRNEILSAKMFS